MVALSRETGSDFFYTIHTVVSHISVILPMPSHILGERICHLETVHPIKHNHDRERESQRADFPQKTSYIIPKPSDHLQRRVEIFEKPK